MLYTTQYTNHQPAFESCTKALEDGQIVFMPQADFELQTQEKDMLNIALLKKGSKNISYDIKTQCIKGFNETINAQDVQDMMHRFAEYAKQVVVDLCPEYKEHLIWGRTSYRPAQIECRASSKLKDDTKLHVDAFVSTPVGGLRILRVFSNINPNQEPRVWNAGEPFPQVLHRFKNQISTYSPSLATLLHKLRITKSKRTAYDHCMLALHDRMKLDSNYQQTVNKQQIDFPSKTTWMVFTDQVSHAALSGQFVLEQTFYLPVNAMQNPDRSPLNQLQAQFPQLKML